MTFLNLSKLNEAPPILLIAKRQIALKNWTDSFFEEMMGTCSAPPVSHNCPHPLSAMTVMRRYELNWQKYSTEPDSR